MRRFPLLLAVLLLAGCGSSEPREQGRILYNAESERSRVRSSLLLTTDAQKMVRVESSRPAIAEPSTSAESIITPYDMGTLVKKLDGDGFFALPGSHTLPQTQAPRSILVDVESRKFYIPFHDLREESEVARYGRACRAIIAASLAGPHDSLPPAK